MSLPGLLVGFVGDCVPVGVGDGDGVGVGVPVGVGPVAVGAPVVASVTGEVPNKQLFTFQMKYSQLSAFLPYCFKSYL